MPQLNLFAEPPPRLPSGMAYEPGFLSETEERALLERLAGLPFAPFAFQGFEGRRRVVSYGWSYDFSAGRAYPSEPISDWLTPVRDRAAAWAGLRPGSLAQALVTEYAPGAPIGWHRDRPIYQDVVGVSLLSACAFRLRRRRPGGWDRLTVRLEPRSIYLLRGEARAEWEHSIPPAEELRYSVTFRSLRQGRGILDGERR